MVRKETVAQKKARYERALADYDAAKNDKAKAEKHFEQCRSLVVDIEPGVYGAWVRAMGTPRQVPDTEQVKKDYAERGETVPTKLTAAPIIVRPA